MGASNHSKLFINDKGQKKYEPRHNDDRLKSHNVPVLSMWCVNFDFQPVVSYHPVLKYIAKYALRPERR